MKDGRYSAEELYPAPYCVAPSGLNFALHVTANILISRNKYYWLLICIRTEIYNQQLNSNGNASSDREETWLNLRYGPCKTSRKLVILRLW